MNYGVISARARTTFDMNFYVAFLCSVGTIATLSRFLEVRVLGAVLPFAEARKREREREEEKMIKDGRQGVLIQRMKRLWREIVGCARREERSDVIFIVHAGEKERGKS